MATGSDFALFHSFLVDDKRFLTIYRLLCLLGIVSGSLLLVVLATHEWDVFPPSLAAALPV